VILSSSAPPILFNSSLVYVAIGSAFMMNETVSMAAEELLRPRMNIVILRISKRPATEQNRPHHHLNFG